MKSTDNLGARGRMLWGAIRWVLPRRVRWFYEGHPGMRGQLWYAERKLLYDTVREHKPQHCFEIGTWRGGGSTLFISQALHDNGGGTLHTVEIDTEFHNDAVAQYQTHLPHLMRHVAFHLGDYRTIYRPVLEAAKAVDFLILDGAEDAQQTLDQYNFFLPYFRSGTVLMVHDWFTEKTRFIKPILETREWHIIRVLTPPASVGLALMKRNS